MQKMLCPSPFLWLWRCFSQCLACLKNLSVLLICSPCPHSANSNVCLFLCSWTGFNQVKSHLSPSAWRLFAHREHKAEPSKGLEEKFSPAESRLPPSIPGLCPPARRTTSHHVCAAPSMMLTQLRSDGSVGAATAANSGLPPIPRPSSACFLQNGESLASFGVSTWPEFI